MGVVGGVVGIAIVGVIAYFVITRNNAAAAQGTKSADSWDIDVGAGTNADNDAFRGCRFANGNEANQANSGPSFSPRTCSMDDRAGCKNQV